MRRVVAGLLAMTVGVVAAAISGEPASGVGPLLAEQRSCFDVAGDPGDVSVVNLTPVLAKGPGSGLLVSSDITDPPVASNVNFGPGSVDPNVEGPRTGEDSGRGRSVRGRCLGHERGDPQEGRKRVVVDQVVRGRARGGRAAR